MITPSAIALGKGDAHLIGLAQAIAESGKPVLIRPLAEMNNSKNPYCAFTPSGGRKGNAYSTRWYKRAFQRIYILMHGGSAQTMTARLRALRLPGMSVDLPAVRVPRMTVVWNPLAVGVPNVAGNHYRDYFPVRLSFARTAGYASSFRSRARRRRLQCQRSRSPLVPRRA